MNEQYNAVASKHINAPTAKVWQALTDPAIVKKYFFGTDVVTDWKVGSDIIYKGVWQGKEYRDYGKILAFEQEKLIETSFYSPSSGLPDSPENYHKVSYILEPDNSGTKITIIQDNNSDDKMKTHSEQNWELVLNNLKGLLEK